MLLHNHCSQWQEVATVLAVCWPDATIEVTEALADLSALMNRQVPHLIILLGLGRGTEYIHYIKNMRSSSDNHHIPILVYNTIPTPEDVALLRQQFSASTF
ncbi:hypothetical protein FLA_4480 [Filimonas lacunae]|nr:hypothetical protein FLA_4480 [Filimonas lacunae]